MDVAPQAWPLDTLVYQHPRGHELQQVQEQPWLSTSLPPAHVPLPPSPESYTLAQGPPEVPLASVCTSSTLNLTLHFHLFTCKVGRPLLGLWDCGKGADRPREGHSALLSLYPCLHHWMSQVLKEQSLHRP